MGNLVSLPVSQLRKMALLWQDEERAFQVVLDVLRDARRFDLVLKLDTFLSVRRRRILTLLASELKKQRALGVAAADPSADLAGERDD